MPEIVANSGLLKKTKVHVDDTGGSGRPVVLIHGWPLSGESWSGQVNDLSAAGYRVITYDRRGFGRSDKPNGGYDYDTLADDLNNILTELDLEDITLVGFSMGGGEVARYLSRHGDEKVRSVVFAASITPYMHKVDDNPEGPLTTAEADKMNAALTSDRDAFLDQFITQFFSVDEVLAVTEQEKQDALVLAHQSDQSAALSCMASFGTTDFRQDLNTVAVPTLVIHGDSDATVPFEGSGQRTHRAIAHSRLKVLSSAPHGCNVSHREEFNQNLIDFLRT